MTLPKEPAGWASLARLWRSPVCRRRSEIRARASSTTRRSMASPPPRLPVRAQPLGGSSPGTTRARGHRPGQRRGSPRRGHRRRRHGDGLRGQRPPGAGGQRHRARPLRAAGRKTHARDRAVAGGAQAPAVDVCARRGRRPPLAQDRACRRPRAHRHRVLGPGNRGPDRAAPASRECRRRHPCPGVRNLTHAGLRRRRRPARPVARRLGDRGGTPVRHASSTSI
jgi:hypothetical protein